MLSNAKTQSTERLTLSVREAARLLGVSERTVRRECERGGLPCVRIGGRVMIPTRPLREKIEASGTN